MIGRLAQRRDVIRFGIFVCGTLVLIATWYWLWRYMAAMTEVLLVPWDVLLGRPPLGTFQRTINDFFESPPGALLPSLVVVAISAGLFVWRLTRNSSSDELPWLFAGSNVVFGVVDFIAVAAARNAVSVIWPWSDSTPGLANGLPSILITLALLIALFVVQFKCTFVRQRD